MTIECSRSVHSIVLMCFAVDIIGLIFGVNNFLAAVQSVITGKHVAECNSEQKVRHTFIAEQLKADEQGSDRAVCHTTENSSHADRGAERW